MKYFDCPLDQLHVNQMFNSRFEIAPSSCKGLAESIEEHGLLQPVIVRRIKKTDGVSAKFMLLAGFRRFIAYKYLLKRDTIPAKLVTTAKKSKDEEINFHENLMRKDLSVTEEAMIVDKLLNEGLTVAEICRRLKRSREWTIIRKDFLSFPDDVKLMIECGEITLHEAMRLVRFAKKRPDRDISTEAKKILRMKKQRNEEIKESKVQKVNYKRRAGNLASYLLQKDGSDPYKQAIATLLWVQEEIPTTQFFQLVGLNKDEAFEFDLLYGEK